MAWLFQDRHQVAKVGGKRAHWSVGWYEPDGRKKQKTFGAGDNGKKDAFRFQRQIEAQLLTGTYESKTPVSWKRFRKEWEKDRASSLSDENRRCAVKAVDHFERICKPARVRTITRRTLDRYLAARRLERGFKKGSKVSAATIDKELGYIKTVLKVAVEWGYMPALPSVPRVRVPEKLVRFVTPEHFAVIYERCSVAARPELPNVIPANWWRALMVFAYMTGWRIKELLALKSADLDLDASEAITRHGDNKGKRDERVRLHPLIVQHLKSLPHFGAQVFPWPHGRKDLWRQFHAIQVSAGIHLECHEAHEHTDSCHLYGFHDFRRAFATENAENLTAKELQTLMRHRSFATTMRYISMARQLRETTTEKLFVPTLASSLNGGNMAGQGGKAPKHNRRKRKA